MLRCVLIDDSQPNKKRVTNLNDLILGDSGGPITVGNSVVGVVSWGVGDCGGGWPDVYIRVSFMYDWVVQAINA